MIAADHSPPSVPTIDQQRDALRKGLGRAVLWAKAGRLDDEPLLAACLEDQRYDAQVVPSRGEWLWQMIQAVDAVDRFREPTLQALVDLKDKRSAGQLCELGCLYALAGDRRFRDRLYAIVEEQPWPNDRRLGEEEIIRIDGEPAFLFAARIRGQRLSNEADAWNDRLLISTADEHLGEGRALALMRDSTDASMRLFREHLEEGDREEAVTDWGSVYQAEMRSTTLDQVLTVARSTGCTSYRLRGWGWYASDADLATVVHHLTTASDPSFIANLLSVFMRRPVPQFVGPLIEFAQSPDAEVRHRALIALEQIEHPLVREFAMARLGVPDQAQQVIGLFRKNFRPGDERRILDAIGIRDDEWDLHSLLMDVVGVLKDQPESDPSSLGVIVYALTPCEMCRFQAAEILLRRDVIPGWIHEECLHDSYERIQKLASKTLEKTDPDGTVTLSD